MKESRSNADGRAACLAVLGTGSDVGKSIVTAALCRVFARQGIRVAPFKAQNMSNNSGVTPEGLEMGRAQIVQAGAARIAPHVDMNPVLIKPGGDNASQVVVLGRPVMNASAGEYYRRRESLWNEARAALDRMRSRYDLIIMEGAGSCAEVNLLDRDIVNLPMAAYAGAPVILVADIDRGGVFAQIVGTLACLDEDQRGRIRGFIINRFRGDRALFREGVRWIEARTGLPVFGVLPWYHGLGIEAEDAVVIQRPEVSDAGAEGPCVAVIRFPRISNFTDLDPLGRVDGLGLVYLEKARDLSRFAAVILPGSKNTRADLQWLETAGWRRALADYVKNGGHVLGICGGYQMLGRAVDDPDGVEGPAGTAPGLGLLPVETAMKAPKTTTRTQFTWDGASGMGYEIHMGRTRRLGGRPLFRVNQRNRQACDADDGCVSDDGRVMGTYLHGLFDSPEIVRKWLQGIGLGRLDVSDSHGPEVRDRACDALADHVEKYLDVAAIARLAGIGG